MLTNYKALLKNDMNAHQFHVSADEVCPICRQTLNPAILICLESLLCGKTNALGPLARVFAFCTTFLLPALFVHAFETIIIRYVTFSRFSGVRRQG